MTCEAQVIPEPKPMSNVESPDWMRPSSFIRAIASGMLAAEVFPE